MKYRFARVSSAHDSGTCAKRIGVSVATVLAIALAGCVPTPPTTSGQVALEGAALGLAGTPAPRIPDDWWRSLGDPQLDMLMAAGLAGSPSIAAATARLKSAEALLGEARAERDPQIAADGQLVRQRLSGRYTIPPPYAGSSRWIGTAQATLDWNLDLFGRQRAAIAEARASADAAALDTGAARLMIEGAIAQAYVDLDRTYRLADVARAFVEGREESVGIVQARIRNGLASQFDAHAAETLLAEARQALLRAESSRAVAENLLATLAGRGPDFARTIVRPMLHLEGIMPLPDVLPADLLGRRPDLLAAQARIDAALAGQRAARADFYPNIDLKALVGIASIGLSSLVSTDAATYGGGPAFRLPIFDGGRLRARYAGAGSEARSCDRGLQRCRAARRARGCRCVGADPCGRCRSRGAGADPVGSGGDCPPGSGAGEERAWQSARRAERWYAAALRTSGGGGASGGRGDPPRAARARARRGLRAATVVRHSGRKGTGMTDTRDDPMTTDPAPAPRGWSPARRRWLGLLAAVVLIGLIAWVVKLLFFTSAAIETDDAYVAGNVVAITAREAGTVVAIHADNTEAVRQGQKLIDLDPATIDVNFAAAEAELARQVRAVRSDFSAVDEGGASVTQAEAALGAAEADYGRRRAAATEGAISGEELAHAADAVTSARAALGVARSRLAQSRSLVQGLPVAQNPNVLAAIASLRRRRDRAQPHAHHGARERCRPRSAPCSSASRSRPERR